MRQLPARCLAAIPAGVFLVLCATTARAQEAAPGPSVKSAPAAPAPLTVTTLPGGVRLVVLREPDSAVAVTSVFFNVNRFDEGARTGINALIARTWGVESAWRGADLTRRDLSQIGGAGTDLSDDWVEMWAVSGTRTDQVAESLRNLLTNLVANPRFSAENVASAKEAQRQARELERDSITSDALNLLRQRVWATSPYGLPLLGTGDALSRLKPDDIATYYRTRFRPDRCVICVAGNVEPEQIAKKVQDSLGAGDWLTGLAAPAVRLPPPEKIPTDLRDQQLGRAAPGLTLMAGFIAPGTLPIKVKRVGSLQEEGGKTEYAALLLLDAALTGGKSSRLFATLRDMPEGENALPLGYDIRSVVQAGQTQSLLAIYIVGANRAAESRGRLLTALQAVAGDKPFTGAEITRARESLKVRHARERQRPRDRATGAGWSEVMGLGAAFDLDFDTILDALTTDDVNRLAHRILSAPSAIVYSRLSEPDAPATFPTLPVTNTAEETPAVP